MWWYTVGKGIQTTAEVYGTIERDSRARSAAQSRAAVMENNARMADYDAQNAMEMGLLNIRNFKRDFNRAQGSARVSAASGGIVVNQGSPLDVLASNAGQAARQEELMRWETQTQVHRKMAEAYNYRYEAYVARASAPSGFSTAVSALGQIGGAVATGVMVANKAV